MYILNNHCYKNKLKNNKVLTYNYNEKIINANTETLTLALKSLRIESIQKRAAVITIGQKFVVVRPKLVRNVEIYAAKSVVLFTDFSKIKICFYIKLITNKN